MLPPNAPGGAGKTKGFTQPHWRLPGRFAPSLAVIIRG